MKAPDKIDITNYHYELPDELIARHPLQERDNSKLLSYRDGQINSHIFHEIPDILKNYHHLIFNNTKVIPARLFFRKETGAEIEILLLEPFSPGEYNLAFQAREKSVWKCLVGNAKKWKSGILEKQMHIKKNLIIFRAEIQNKDKGFNLVSFSWDNPDISFPEILQVAGVTPLPPYLKRQAEYSDKERYQTIYSKFEGSVAAPTAGLHFTESIFEGLRERKIGYSNITLHIGAGTFLPVKENNAVKHNMHIEHFSIAEESIRELLAAKIRLVPVGTTTIRTLESLYWIAVKITEKFPEKDLLFLDQWEHYQLKDKLSRSDALQVVLEYMRENNLDHLNASTRIMITPGYKFRMTDGIITNFHQPGSTLLLLIAAFAGDDWRRIYDYALKNNYRFLSYGDSSILL